MRKSTYLQNLYALVLSAFVTIGGATATSANTDLTDVWWTPTESGWGMEIVNTGTFAFASFYVYAANGSPTWFTGQLQKVPGTALVTYSGPVYVTTGPYYGGAFNPSAVTIRQAGTMTFVASTTTTGQVTYSVDGVVVTKQVERQPLTLDNYNGNYFGVYTFTDSGCTNPAENGSGAGQVNINITQNGSSIAIGLSANGSACSLVGTYSQRGRMGQVSGNYSCADGSVGTASLFEMNNVPFMFTARMQTHDNASGCNESAEITGLIPR